MSYNKQYGHVDRSTLAHMTDELEAKIDGQPTPEPEPVTDYATYCSEILGGTWDGSYCTFNFMLPETGEEVQKVYDANTIDSKIACENNWSTWDLENDWCCNPECECVKYGGTWIPETGECVHTVPDPCGGEPICECEMNGGTWIPGETPEDPGYCQYPEE